MVKQACRDEDILRCFDVISELRTHLKKHEFLGIVRQLEIEGYRLVYMEAAGDVVTVAGYRIVTNLFMGKTFYVDDLVTSHRHRSKGYGKTLMTYLREIAYEEKCQYFHLDSGTQRHEAHKFYFRQGLKIASYHFSEQLDYH